MDELVNSHRENELGAAPPALKIGYLASKLRDAESLLVYAAEAGIEIDAELTKSILAARVAEERQEWTAELAESLLSTLAVLAAKLRPVTVESLKLCANDVEARKTLKVYKKVAVWLAIVIIPFSFITFVGSNISKSIDAYLERANALAVTVSNDVSPLPQAPGSAPQAESRGARKGAAEALQRGVSEADVIRNLQEFAAVTRAIYASALNLDFMVGYAIADPYPDADSRKDALELPPDLPDLAGEATRRIRVYQRIRYFAQTAQGHVGAIYGAFAACVLPVLYALLGACAYLLRQFEEQVRMRTLTETDGHVAHFVIAAISGAVIGLFSNLNFGQGASISPLAVAFLGGYAADVFFSFLEGLIQSFSRVRPAAGAAAPSANNSR